MTRLPAPWMADCEIREIQAERDKLEAKAHATNTKEACDAFRNVRNKIKIVIGKTKRAFLMNALSSKRPRDV